MKSASPGGDCLRWSGPWTAGKYYGGVNSIVQRQQQQLRQSSPAVHAVTNTDRFLEMISSTKAKQTGVWVIFFTLVALLRGFYPVILGTFLLSYTGNSAVNMGMEKGNELLAKWNLPVKRLPRRLYALAYILLLQSLIISLSVLTLPRLNVEFQFLAQIGEKENPYMLIVDWAQRNFGPDALRRLEPFLLTVGGESGRVFAGYEANAQELIASQLKSRAIWSAERNAQFAKLVQFCLGGYLRKALGFTKLIVGQLTKVLYKATLSLLFSFMIVWDLPRLRRGMQTVRESNRLRFAYNTVGPQVESFAGLVGQSFEVQFLIALANTVLTTLGLMLLKVRGAFVLSTVVFLCSFVPVAGVFVSTIPMALAALSDYGVMKVFEVMGMVLFVHALEAYLLNPYLYASKLKLHPIVVLAVLYVTEHVVGVQGLILAVPVAVYVINSVLGVPADPAPVLGKGKSSLEASAVDLDS